MSKQTLGRWRTTRHTLGLYLVAVLCYAVLLSPASAQDWVQPERSQANLDALARVELKTYGFEEAGDIEMEYGLYVPTSYTGGHATQLVVALHGLPVMVVMGDADESVEVKVTRQWVAKMEELGMTHEYIEVPGGSHSSAGRGNIDNVFAFLDTHRKP